MTTTNQLVCCSGDAQPEINVDNITAAMWYHEQRNRPSLDIACKQYLERQVNNLEAHTAIPLLRILDCFGVVELRAKCVAWMARNYHEFKGYGIFPAVAT